MGYSGLLFNQIPYEVRENDEPIYEESTIESYLLAHYLGNKKDLLNDVISIFHDDKHSGNMITVNTRKTKGTFWYPASNCEEIENFEDNDPNAVGFIFQIDYLQENIVKRVCTELGITQKELDEKSYRLKVAEKLIELSSVHKDDIKKFREVVSEHLEDIKAEKDVRTIMVGEAIPSSNIIKEFCKEFNMTYAQLAKAIGYKTDTINKAASTGNISEQIKRAIELYEDNITLRNSIDEYFQLKAMLKNMIK